MKLSYGIAVFHNIGDILLCTPVARQLKADNPDCEVIWYTSEKYKFILENNPFIDQVVSLEGEPLELDKSVGELKLQRQWTKFFTPAAYMNYDKMIDESLPELVKSYAGVEWTVPFVPVIRLSEAEKARAAAYWNELPSGKKILLETEFDSQQSPLTEEYIDKLLEIFSSISPVFVFTAKNKPAYFEKLKNKYSNVFWCKEEFRLNAEFYNLCDAFVGVSSGISCLSNSDYCRNDVPHLEISRGYHWSNASYFSRKKELYVSYSYARYVDGLHWLLNKLTDSAAKHCFSPRFISGSYVYGTKEIVPCSLCGATSGTIVRGQDIVRCSECKNIYLRARMTKSAMEKYYSEVYAVNQSSAAAPVRVPRSKEEIDLLPEFIGAQRRGVLAEIQSLLKVDLAGKVLIDIGCGWGAFLHHARNQGMKVMGFEFTIPNVEFGRNVLNIDIRRQQFIDADDIQENSVDIIVMNHALEHVPYPFEFLEKIEYVLKPGGIFFGMVPNFESICSKAMLENWAWIETDWHYTHFTPKTLKETLAQTGFYIEKLHTTSGDYGDDIPISILKKVKPGLNEPNYKEHLKEFQRRGKGEQINVIAVKRGSSKGRIMAAKNILTSLSRPAAVQTDSVRNIIWLRTDSIGDAVLSSSMLPHLRKKYPAASITVVCQEHIAELYEACDVVDRVVTIPTEHRWKDQRQYDEFLDTIRALNPDLLINSVYSVHGLSDLKGLEFIPQRIAIRQSSRATYTSLIPISSEIKSELQRHLAFLHGLGIDCESLEPSAWITQADIDYADAVLSEYGLDSRNTIAFFAGTRTDNRTYEGYADALRPIVERLGCSVIALGGAAEHAINQVQLDALKTKTVNLCGKVTLRQSAAILSRCRIAFGAETGLAHIAAAIGVPHVVLIGGGHFGRFMPYSPLTSLVCLPLNCYGCDWSCRYKQVRCIRGVEPYVITRALEDCMSGSSDKTRIYLQNSVPSEYDNRLLASAAITAFANPDQVSLVYVDSQENPNIHNRDSSYDVSIVLATKNRAKLLDNMISSLKAAAEGISYEIIVIEGGSSDDTSDILRKHNITQIYNEEECLGPGRHSWPQLYNLGFSKARGKWAMYASDDITFSKNCVSKALEILNKQCEEVAGGIFYYKNLCSTDPQWADFGIDFTYGPKLLMNYGLLRLDYFRQFGGLDEAYRFYCADGDLCLKLYENGKQFIPLPGCFVTHNNVLDVQKKENLQASNSDIELYLKRWLHFVPTNQLPNPRRLMWKQNPLEQSNADALKSASDNEKIYSDTSENIILEFQKKGLLHANEPLRLHLGCGEKHLEGYINIDYPQSEHTVMKPAADYFADIVDLAFPPGSVDEIRLHHVFEHFDRAVAMGLLCKWHQWLKKGGIICIETPDVEASSNLLLGQDLSYRQIQGVIRHMFGSHEASWAIHKEGWYEARFRHVLGALGFNDMNFQQSGRRITRNITVIAKKAESVDSKVICAAAKKLLRDYMVDESASEEKVWSVWCKKIDDMLGAACLGQSQNAGSQQAPGDSKGLTVLIFSKDRAMQLQAAIESFNLHCRDNTIASIVVLFKASNLVHKQQYDELKKKFPAVAFVEETDFRKQVLSLVGHCRYVLFMVDDNMFVKPFLLKDITMALDAEKRAIGFSLRLGKNTEYCYSLSSPQKLPAFERFSDAILKYNWPGTECDFGYPLEVSSSVYRSGDILGLLNQLEYSNPNTLEHGMSKNVRMFVSSAPILLVFEESAAFCNPVNMVQRVYENNKFGKTHRYTSEQLAEGFSRGMTIDVQRYAGFTPNSAHQEVELYFKSADRVIPEAKITTAGRELKPKFSIVMANYNNGSYIAQSIVSVLSQTFKDWELIIVDDCSTDDSIEMINRFDKDNRVRLIRHDANKGYVAALKTGIAAVKSELFGVLDSDDYLTVNAVETMYQQHVKFPDCGLIYSQFMCCDDNLTPVRPGYCRDMPHGKTTLDIDVVSHFKTFKLADYLKTPGYDESILYAEDRDIIHKMEEVTQLRFVDECLYLYREVPYSQSHNARKKAIGIMSRERAKTAARLRRDRKIKAYEPENNPLVSIWMAAYNSADYIAQAIESVLVQNYRNFELIVVDDGSTDRTADIVRGFKHDSIKYFLKEHGGLASARNVQIKKSSGAFIVILDSDDMMTPDFLARHLQMFEQHLEADIVYCDDCLIDEQDKPIRIIDRPEYPTQNAMISDIFRCGFPVVPFRTCIRKSVFDKIGFYDEKLLVAEDYDMLRRFVNQGLRMQHLPGAFYLRRMNTNSNSRSFNAAKAKSQFEAIRRFTETFTPQQLFPDVKWDKLPADQMSLLAKCKSALVYLGVGQEYQKTNAPDYAEAGFELACAQLDDCCKIEPANQQVRNLREKCLAIRAKHSSSGGVYQTV